ncbi:MAG TPA: hypothetical protein VLN56_05980 [Gammaproteobacteria bacterium]|nr:hypothetical protein [Gammaproteobacteria bacterium]
MSINLYRQKGFSVLIAIALVVLFSLLGAYMATLTTVSGINTAGSAGAMQAWFAARSGVDWAVHRALTLNTCTGVNGQILNFSGGSMTGFQSAISCSETTGITEGPDTYNIYNISSLATRGAVGQENFVSRNITVTVTDRGAP